MGKSDKAICLMIKRYFNLIVKIDDIKKARKNILENLKDQQEIRDLFQSLGDSYIKSVMKMHDQTKK